MEVRIFIVFFLRLSNLLVEFRCVHFMGPEGSLSSRVIRRWTSLDDILMSLESRSSRRDNEFSSSRRAPGLR